MGWMEPFQLLHSSDGIAGNLKQMLSSVFFSLKERSIFTMRRTFHITWYQFSYGSFEITGKKNKIQLQLYAV